MGGPLLLYSDARDIAKLAGLTDTFVWAREHCSWSLLRVDAGVGLQACDYAATADVHSPVSWLTPGIVFSRVNIFIPLVHEPTAHAATAGSSMLPTNAMLEMPSTLSRSRPEAAINDSSVYTLEPFCLFLITYWNCRLHREEVVRELPFS